MKICEDFVSRRLVIEGDVSRLAKSIMPCCLVLAMLFDLPLSKALAQEAVVPDTSLGVTSAPTYVIRGASVLSMNVSIWGAVSRPGYISLEATADLITALSSVGGPTNYANLKKVRIIRRETWGGQRVLTVEVDRYMKEGYREGMPVLRPEDTIYVPSTFGARFTSSLGYFSTIAGLVALVAHIVERFERAGWL